MKRNKRRNQKFKELKKFSLFEKLHKIKLKSGKTKIGRIMFLSKYAVCHVKRSKFIKEQ